MQMNICSDNISDIHGLCMNALESTHEVDELGVNLTKFLNIEDATEDDLISPSSPKSCEFGNKDASSKSRYSKEPDVNVTSCDPSGLRSTSLPTHLKPVSAMKGSREKRGATPPSKLTVKWAPDVYDPIPTSVSHVVTHNRSSRHSKKVSKNKQKNTSKSSRGNKGKDKKQVRKRGGHSSGMGYKLSDFEEELVDFHVGKPDQLCGSSFMKSYGTNLQLSSLAEAT